MHQRSRARRRFHTGRVVANRRRRYLREQPEVVADVSHPRLAYGRLADRDPWDCGGRCLLCHADKLLDGARRARERRQWRRDWGLA